MKSYLCVFGGRAINKLIALGFHAITYKQLKTTANSYISGVFALRDEDIGPIANAMYFPSSNRLKDTIRNRAIFYD